MENIGDEGCVDIMVGVDIVAADPPENTENQKIVIFEKRPLWEVSEMCPGLSPLNKSIKSDSQLKYA